MCSPQIYLHVDSRITERNAKNYPFVILFFSDPSVANISLSKIANRSAKSVQHEMHSFANNKLTKARIIGRAGLQPPSGIIQLLSRVEETARQTVAEQREKEVCS